MWERQLDMLAGTSLLSVGQQPGVLVEEGLLEMEVVGIELVVPPIGAMGSAM